MIKLYYQEKSEKNFLRRNKALLTRTKGNMDSFYLIVFANNRVSAYLPFIFNLYFQAVRFRPSASTRFFISFPCHLSILLDSPKRAVFYR
nr:MAG TPA: hypothetical protein [Bacteriophage sp.]